MSLLRLNGFRNNLGFLLIGISLCLISFIGCLKGTSPNALDQTTGSQPLSTSLPTLTPPTSLSLSQCGQACVRLSWNLTADTSEFDILRGNSSATLNLLDATSSTTYEDHSVSSGQIYFYAVRAKSKDSISTASTVGSIMPISNFSISGISIAGVGSVQLNWSAAVGASLFKVFYSAQPGGPYLMTGCSVSNTNCTITDLVPNTPYYFVVTATNLVGSQAQIQSTNSITGTPMGSFDIQAPTILNSSISLAWSPSAGATSYHVTYGTTSGQYDLGSHNTNSTSLVVSGLSNGTKYYFMVTAQNAFGSLSSSTEVSVTPGITLTKSSGDTQLGTVATILGAPLIVKVSDSNGNGLANIGVNWNVNSGGGSLSNCSVVTDVSGLASCKLQLGTVAGTNNNVVQATILSGSQTLTVIFNESSKAGMADHLVFSAQPIESLVDVFLPVQPQVQIVDIYNNKITSGVDSTASITLSIYSGSGNLFSDTISCSVTPSACRLNATSGTASFSNLRLDTAQLGLRLLATKQDMSGSGGSGALLGMSNGFDITACGGNKCPGCWTLTTPGIFQWQAPSNWTNSNNTIELIGGGGGGTRGDNFIGGGAGGGGAYARGNNVPLTSNTSYSVVIGHGGIAGINVSENGGDGGATTFNGATFLSASGGHGGYFSTGAHSIGGAGGSASGTKANVFISGGSAETISTQAGANAGGAAGRIGSGGVGSTGNSGGGTLSRLIQSGKGADGSIGASIFDGGAGNTYGGGGGGAFYNTGVGGVGASGAIFIKCF